MSDRKTPQEKAYPVRLDPELSMWIRGRAKAGDRSINAEINRQLRRAKEVDEQKQTD